MRPNFISFKTQKFNYYYFKSTERHYKTRNSIYTRVYV